MSKKSGSKGTANPQSKKVVFSEKIDSAIDGYTLGVTCLGIGIFLLLKPDYFAIPMVSYIIGAFIGAIGVIGIGIELSKTNIKGIDNIIIGSVFLAPWLFTYLKYDNIWFNVFMFLFLVIGCYFIALGIIQGGYSIAVNSKPTGSGKKVEKSKLISQIVLFLTQLCGLAIAVINILKAVNA